MNVTTLAELCEHLERHVEQIMARWLALATEDPWGSLPIEERVDDVPDLVLAILRTALCAPDDLGVHRSKVEVALRHGEQRRGQGFDERLLFVGYHFIRGATTLHLNESGLSDESATDALLRIDMATTIASTASLRGFYRAEHERLGRWSEIVDEMARESYALQSRH